MLFFPLMKLQVLFLLPVMEFATRKPPQAAKLRRCGFYGAKRSAARGFDPVAENGFI